MIQLFGHVILQLVLLIGLVACLFKVNPYLAYAAILYSLKSAHAVLSLEALAKERAAKGKPRIKL